MARSVGEARGLEWLAVSTLTRTISRTRMTISARDIPPLCSAATLARTESRNVFTKEKRLVSSGETDLSGNPMIPVGIFFMSALAEERRRQ